MTLMLVFLMLCVILGLWLPRSRRFNWLIFSLAALLVLVFMVSPGHL